MYFETCASGLYREVILSFTVHVFYIIIIIHVPDYILVESNGLISMFLCIHVIIL